MSSKKKGDECSNNDQVVLDDDTCTESDSLVYRGSIQFWELFYGLLLIFYAYLLTDEGCGKVIALGSLSDVRLSCVCIRIYSTILVLVFTAAIWLVRRENNKYVRRLEKSVERLPILRAIARRFNTVHDNLHLIFLRHLEAIGETLRFGRNDRISLYYFDTDESAFVQVARHSKNPDYKQPGRWIYPIDEGIIARTRAGDEMVYIPSLPSYEADPQRYVEYMVSNFNMKNDAVEKLTMHPRFMAGMRVSSPDGNDWKAVLIVESDRANAWQKKELNDVLIRNKLCIYKLMCDFPDCVPSIPAARKAGL